MGASSTSPSEESPLLESQNNHAIEEGQSPQQDGTQEAESTLLADEPSTSEILAILCTVWIGVFFGALDTTIVATLTTPISSSFHSLSLLSWLATAYLIANSACQPLAGKLTDIFSRKSEWVVILGRVISGIGGGGLTAIATFVTSDLVPLRERGVWQGYGNIVFGMGMGLGGVFGGWLADGIGWRWAFLIQVPFVAVSTVMVYFLVNIPVKESTKPSLKRIDFLGAGLLVTFLVLLLIGLNTGGNQLPWKNPWIIVSLVMAFLFFLVFIYVEDQVALEPIIPVRLVARRTVLSACLANWFSTMAIFIAEYYVPFYLQVRGLSATQAGLRQIPVAVGVSVGSLGVGYIMRHTGKYYILSCFVMIMMIAGAALLCTFQLETPTWATYLYVAPEGLAYGSMLTITVVAMISAVDHKDQAVITAASYAFRSTGSTIGLTIAGAIFQNILSIQLQNQYGDRPGSAKVIQRVKNDLKELDRLPKGWDRDTVMGFYMDGLRGAFISGLGLAVLATIASLFMREHVLHKNLARNQK